MFANYLEDGVPMPELNQGLADAVRWWITDHGELTQAVISAKGGPSSTTMTKILKGEGSVRQKALTDLDRALGWGRGRAEMALAGQLPSVQTAVRDLADEVLTGELTRRLVERAQLLNERASDGRADAEEAAEPGEEGPGAGGGEGRPGAAMTKADVDLAARDRGKKLADREPEYDDPA